MAAPAAAIVVRFVSLTLLAGIFTAPSHAAAPCTGQLSSADSIIAVEAGDAAPRLSRLTLRGGASWENRTDEPLPGRVEVNGVSQSMTWKLDRASCRFDPSRIDLVYISASPRLELTWEWRRRAQRGPLEHRIVIRNASGESIWLPWQPSFKFAWAVDIAQPLERFWVEKGADAPSSAGTHRDALREGDHWFGVSSTYARPLAHQPREMIPYLLVDDPAGSGAGWYLGIEFSGRTRITLERAGDHLSGTAGLNPDPGPYRTRLPPAGVFETPTIFLGAFAGGADDAGNILRRWIRAVLNNPRTVRDPTYPTLVNNSWGSGMAVDEALAKRMIRESRRLGLEMYHLDAGWFRGVGDWHADSAKFPSGIASLADFAHAQGLKFGLWVDFTQAGVSSRPGARNVNDPETRDWLIGDPPDNWQHREQFKGITMDLGVPAAQAWALAEVSRLVTENHLDMLEHDGYLVAQGSSRSDHPAAAPAPGTLREYEDSGYLWVDGSNSTDVSDHATRAYYAIYERLRLEHPRLLLELCNDGGRMVDFGSAAHGDYFSITDVYDPLSNRRAFFDASFVLPPAMLESYVEKWPTPTLDNFRYMLRSGMMGWFSLMQDSAEWSAQQHAAAAAEISLYKSALRPLIRTADLYHVAERPDGVHWDGIEYFSSSAARGVLFAFRGSTTETAHRYLLAGLDAERSYRITFHDRGAAATAILSGATLMRDGVEVSLATALSSELVFIDGGRTAR
ncbi:MAG TPA: alpha-galactosidase [Steroidobacteraceae bacterium]